ncbi:putative POT oligopeptide transporter [Aspergillus clavatus NRRL 1]|uniref:POT oligopeptide transporter, putative n=1 Tax=Aspergillus clavatus (strain ATCC 1007 / CBS 513.65 / DSM 816 / NCTC 3887 / NRRL 1 / QM 1276 / 107) TaxID=344612 RepID=A1C8B8_ASPCL|nr:POT oligopeptide transporter, putative [Aspergillus clavatus NRRL 1]EAW14639.1 POT oligopeptide transporter, putative [Aspergillus clavatus NRRL 1]
MAVAEERCRDNDLPAPTEWEVENLRRVCDNIPSTIFLIAVAELAERFTYRCITAPMQNYIENAQDDPLRPGALNKGQGVATGINYFFTGWCYMAPILGAVMADTLLGRYQTICLGTGVASCGVSILFVTSFPTSLEHGAGLPGLIVALVLIGLGFGGIKSNVAPLIAEQYSRKPLQIKTLGSGDKVIVDPNLTIQTIYGRYYWVINIGSLSVIPASWLELKVSFWAAFLLPLCFWVLPVSALVVGRGRYIVQKPSGSVLIKAMRVIWLALKGGCNLDAAKPSVLTQTHPATTAATMKTYGIPNDMMGCFNPIMVLTFLPTMEKVVYPALRRFRLSFKPISRITAGFLVMACAIGYSAGIQDLIYRSPPCYDHPLNGSCSDGGRTPNDVSVFLQVPIYAMTALSEVLAYVAGMEYAYTKAPKSMRSIVSSLFLLTCTIGSMLGITLSPVSKDPKVLIEYASLSIVMLLTAVLFLLIFSKYNKIEEKMNMLNSEEGNSISPNGVVEQIQTTEKA